MLLQLRVGPRFIFLTLIPKGVLFEAFSSLTPTNSKGNINSETYGRVMQIMFGLINYMLLFLTAFDSPCTSAILKVLYRNASCETKYKINRAVKMDAMLEFTCNYMYAYCIAYHIALKSARLDVCWCGLGTWILLRIICMLLKAVESIGN